MKPDEQKSDNWLVCIVLAIGSGSYLVKQAVAHPLVGPCGPLLSLARPLLTAIRAEEIRKGHSQLGLLVSLARYPPALFSMKSISPDGFFGIQILQNSISAGAPLRTPLEVLTTLPWSPSRLGKGILPPFPTSIDLLHRGSSVTDPSGPPTFQMLPLPMVL